MSDLRAGTAREEITPPPGIRLSGFAGRPGPNTGCRDPLLAGALFLTDGGAGALILTLDVIGLSPEVDARLREMVAARLGIAADAVLIACSHTHSGPATMDLRATGDIESEWTEEVLKRSVQAAVATQARATPVTARHGRGQCFANMNRRQRRDQGAAIGHDQRGPCDSNCRVLLLESADGPLATLVHYAMHPVVLGSENLRVSADWVGAMRAQMEQALSCPALFLQGCCGDINPRIRGTDAICDAVGADVAGSALSAMTGLQAMETPDLRAGTAEARIPVRPLPPEEEFTRVEQEAQEHLADDGAPLGRRHLAQADLDWAAACRALRQSGTDSGSISGRVSALKVGDIILIGLPGEIFTEIGADIQAAVPQAWPVGYANGNLGYLYPDRAVAEGGYEVTVAYRLYGERQADVGTAGALVEAARKAAGALGAME